MKGVVTRKSLESFLTAKGYSKINYRDIWLLRGEPAVSIPGRMNIIPITLLKDQILTDRKLYEEFMLSLNFL